MPFPSSKKLWYLILSILYILSQLTISHTDLIIILINLHTEKLKHRKITCKTAYIFKMMYPCYYFLAFPCIFLILSHPVLYVQSLPLTLQPYYHNVVKQLSFHKEKREICQVLEIFLMFHYTDTCYTQVSHVIRSALAI